MIKFHSIKLQKNFLQFPVLLHARFHCRARAESPACQRPLELIFHGFRDCFQEQRDEQNNPGHFKEDFSKK